jgi:hypothetical protein
LKKSVVIYDWDEACNEAYLYNLGIMSIMPVAGGFLTKKKTLQCLAV